jgi:hypothetical protein
MSIRRRLSCWLAGGALSAALLVTGAQSVAAAGPGSCAGGPIAPGSYASLTVSGFCLAAIPGTVNVTGNLTVASGGVLLAAFGASNVTVGGNLVVQPGGILILGCEPFAFTCFDDPNLRTNDSIAGNLAADGAVMVLAHADSIGGNVVQSGGGGGLNCNLLPFGPPAYSTYEDNTIKGNAIIEGLTTCWAGFFRNTVGGNVNYDNNMTFDEDGNEIATNTISGSLNCFANDPAIQFGDSRGIPNTVGGKVHGQCTAVV